MLLILGILLLLTGVILYRRAKLFELRLEKLKLVNCLFALEVISNVENKEAYIHWDYEKYLNDEKYILLPAKDYIRKYLWFYNLPDQRIHYRK